MVLVCEVGRSRGTCLVPRDVLVEPPHGSCLCANWILSTGPTGFCGVLFALCDCPIPRYIHVQEDADKELMFLKGPSGSFLITQKKKGGLLVLIFLLQGSAVYKSPNYGISVGRDQDFNGTKVGTDEIKVE